MGYAYDASLLERVKPRISQWEATTGRRISPSMLDALIKGELEAEVGKAQQSRALDLQEQGLADAKEAQKKADKAAKTKGIVDTASTAGMGYLTYKAVTKPSAMSELLAHQKSLGAVPGTGVPLTSAVNPAVTPAFTPGATSLTAGTSGIEYGTGITAGAQTTLAGGTTVAGGQAALAGGEAGSLAAYDAALAEGAAEGVGTVGAGGAGASSYLLPVAAGLTAFQLAKPLLKKVGSEVKGLGEGSKIDESMKKVVDLPKADQELGQVLNNILGDDISSMLDVSVICSELLRQGRITERERTACVVFRFRRIPDPMFRAYLEWAAPIVAAMKRGGWRNALLLPFAIRFVNYMIATQTGIKPTLAELLVWKYAWWKCSRIAQKQGAMMIAEVA